MIDDYAKFGRYGMWQDAKELCEKLGIRFEITPDAGTESRKRGSSLRSDASSQSGAAGIGLPSGAEEVLQLILEAYKWGEKKGWPVCNKYPQYNRIRQLGEKINRSGGIGAMRRVAAFVEVRTPFGSMTLLNDMWHLIGEWIA